MSKTAQASEVVMPTPEMWQLIIEFARARVDDQALEQDLIKQRDKYREDLNRMGDGEKIAETPEYKRTMVAWGRTLRAITACRPRIEYYGNAVDEAINYAAQGLFWDLGKIEEMRAGAKDAARDKTYRDVETSAHELAEEYKRREAKEKAEKEKAAGKPPVVYADTKVSTLEDLGAKAQKQLKDAGLITLGDANRYLGETPTHTIYQNFEAATVDALRRHIGRISTPTPPKPGDTPKADTATTPDPKANGKAVTGAGLTPKKTDSSGKPRRSKK